MTLIKSLSRDVTVLVIEHDMDVAFELGEYFTIMNQGSVVAEGDAAAIRSNSEIQSIYFGEGDDMTGPLLIDDIHAYYGDSYVLQGLSLAVRDGETVAVLGRNGVGKTTLIRSIVGFAPPARGRIIYDGETISGLAPTRSYSRGFALVPQGRRIFRSLSVEETLTIAACERPAVAPGSPGRSSGLMPFSAVARTAQATFRQLIRRRAADAGDGTGAG